MKRCELSATRLRAASDRQVVLQGTADPAQRRLVGRQGIEPAHHHVEDPLARRLAGEIVGRALQHLLVDQARERAEHRALRREQVAELREADTLAACAMIGESRCRSRAGFEARVHQRVDDRRRACTGDFDAVMAIS